MRANMRTCRLESSPYGIDTRSIGACLWMYSPLRRRSERKSSSCSCAGQEAARLIAELRDALVHEPLVDLVVLIHGRDSSPGSASATKYGLDMS